MNDEKEELETDWVKWHGMNSVLPIIRTAVGLDVDGVQRKKGLNGWAVLAVTVGIDIMSKRITARLDTFSLISALILAITLNIISSPNSNVITFATGQTGNVLAYKYAYLGLAVLSCICHFSVIILSTLLTTIYRVCARHCDMWRVVCSTGSFASIIDVLFTLGNVSVSYLLGIILIANLGIVIGLLFGSLIFIFCGILIHVVNSCYILPLGHPIHGWLKLYPDEFDLRKPFQKIKSLAEYDRQNRVLDVNSSLRNLA